MINIILLIMFSYNGISMRLYYITRVPYVYDVCYVTQTYASFMFVRSLHTFVNLREVHVLL